MNPSKFGRFFTIAAPLLAAGCTLWPPELPPAISNKEPATASDSTASTDDCPNPEAKTKRREEFLYIE
jgi:hypothetical protein